VESAIEDSLMTADPSALPTDDDRVGVPVMAIAVLVDNAARERAKETERQGIF